MTKTFSRLAGIAFLGLCLGLAHAQTVSSAEDGSLLVYRIKPGDTFNKFAQKYLIQPVDMPALQKVNRLQNINLLAVGAELYIPRHLVKQVASKATVMGTSCANPILLRNSGKTLKIGTSVVEGDVVEVPAECHVSLLLEDGSIIRLPSSAALKISTLRKNMLEPAPEVKLDLTRGRIELDVQKGRAKSTPFEVRTPISIMGVRGTEFRVGYSPEDQTGQVEVLGGIVQTQGSQDSQGQPITQGLGLPINNVGQSLAVEKLLDAPLFHSVQVTEGKQPSYVAQLQPVKDASYYIADSANTANLTGNRSTVNLLSAELFIPKLTKQAVFYQLTSVSASGLVGTERQYAFCAPNTDNSVPRCSAIFDAPLADGTAISFALSRLVDGSQQTLVNTQTLQARNGRFAIQGIPEGNYTWALSYRMPQAAGSDTPETTIHQSGKFELITLNTHKP